jgi:gamma-glutamylaminecyclotransferase
MTHRVFVYGTLLAGERNHHVLGEAVCLGPARTAPAFELYDFGPYPGLVAGGKTRVVGEVYAVDDATLARLDWLEGYPHLYDRQVIDLEEGEAIAYTVRADQVWGLPRVAHGDWRASRLARRGP